MCSLLSSSISATCAHELREAISARAFPSTFSHLDYSDSQLPPSYDYLYVDEQYPEGPFA